MASVRQLTEILTEVTGEDPWRVRAIARALVDNELLPKARGRAIPEITYLDAARLLLGIYVADIATGAAPAVMTYGQLMGEGHNPDLLQAIFWSKPLNCEQFLAKEIDEVGEGRVDFVQICLSWPEVVFESTSDDEIVPILRFVKVGKNPNFWQSDKPKKSVTIPRIALARIKTLVQAAVPKFSKDTEE